MATTEIYARTDTELERRALEHAYPTLVSDDFPDWTDDDALLALLTWLTRL